MTFPWLVLLTLSSATDCECSFGWGFPGVLEAGRTTASDACPDCAWREVTMAGEVAGAGGAVCMPEYKGGGWV